MSASVASPDPDFARRLAGMMPQPPKRQIVAAQTTPLPVNRAEARINPTLPLEWFEDIQPVLEARDFVQGLLTEGAAGVVYGESNAGKTFWTTDLALHVAAGKEWNGRRVEQGAVLYAVLEGGNGFRNRVAAWRKAHGYEQTPLPFAAVPVALNLLDPEADTPRLVQTIRTAEARAGHPFKLIIIDTLSRAMAGGNENAPDDMGALVRNMDAIRQATGAAVLFIHHSGKDQARGARGHSLLRAAIDTEIEVTADDTAGTKAATVVKQRDLTKGAVFGFRLDTVVLGQNEHGEDVTTCVAEPLPGVAATRGPDKRRALTVEEMGWAKDVADFFATPGKAQEEVVPEPGMPPVRAATRDQIRGWLQERGRIGVAPSVALTATERSTLLRTLNRLKDKGKLCLNGTWVWLP